MADYSNHNSAIYENCVVQEQVDEDYEEFTEQPTSYHGDHRAVVTQPSRVIITTNPNASHETKPSKTSPVSGLPRRQYSVNECKRDWSTDLFLSVKGNPQEKSFIANAKQAFRDCGCITCTMCDLAKRLGDAQYVPFLPCTGPAIRFKVRIVGGITGSLLNDCLVASFCWPCAVCQMHRELETIGI